MRIRLNHQQVQQYLPHRYPFLFIDQVDEVVPGESIRAHKCVSGNEELFNGHFPGNPVMPGVLQIEAMGQCGALLGLLSGAGLDDGKSIYVVKITDCKFRRPVVPGDVMDLRAKLVKQRLGMWTFECTVHVGDTLASQATIVATTGPKVQSPPLPDHLPKPSFEV